MTIRPSPGRAAEELTYYGIKSIAALLELRLHGLTLDDQGIVPEIDSIEVNRTEKNRQWVWVSMVFVAGGVLLGLLSFILFSSLLSPLLMALSLALIGVVFYLTYAGGSSGEVIMRAGMKDIKCKMQSKALDDMAKFVQRIYELKLGYSSEALAMLDYLDSSSEEPTAEGEHDDMDEAAVPTETSGSNTEV